MVHMPKVSFTEQMALLAKLPLSEPEGTSTMGLSLHRGLRGLPWRAMMEPAL